MADPVSITDVQKGQKFQIAGKALQPFASADDFRLAHSMATQLAGSTLVPKRFQSNVMDCILAIDMAARSGSNPLMVLQNLYVVHGTPGWSGQYIIAAINQCGRFAEPLHFEFVGERGKDSWGCYATTVTESGRVINGPTVTIGLAKAEGWYGRTGSKWATIPELMLRYRAGSWFGKTECPEILMGFPADDEIRDGGIIDMDPETGEVIQPGKPFVPPSGGSQAEPVAKTIEDFIGSDVEARRLAELNEHGYWKSGDSYINAIGGIWNPEIHATSTEGLPIVNQDGTFRARRGTRKSDDDQGTPDGGPTQAESKPAPTPAGQGTGTTQSENPGYGLD